MDECYLVLSVNSSAINYLHTEERNEILNHIVRQMDVFVYCTLVHATRSRPTFGIWHTHTHTHNACRTEGNRMGYKNNSGNYLITWLIHVDFVRRLVARTWMPEPGAIVHRTIDNAPIEDFHVSTV